MRSKTLRILRLRVPTSTCTLGTGKREGGATSYQFNVVSKRGKCLPKKWEGATRVDLLEGLLIRKEGNGEGVNPCIVNPEL